ncbi:MAG: hypothetical protein NC548_28365 [Lachnospiraceae bacterium]|nr:hypothetical protein [Lachnospiraceae bacterium]MCM1232004.1 hypothetical protein [Ruminococcus flavefaciens]
MGIKRDYLQTAVDTIKKMHPEFHKEDIEKAVSKVMKERFKDPTITMDNNVTGEGMTTTLTGLCNWIEKRNPVISGNATFYMQPSEMLSPTSNMLRALKMGRKLVKKEMFRYKPGSDEYAALDLDQNNKKVIMNAEYGGSGAPTAAFYTKYSPAATTLMAQSIITTMASFFEGYIGDRQVFFNVNECFDWMNKVCQKDEKIPNWVMRHSPKEISRRILNHFYTLNAKDIPHIERYVEACTPDQQVYLYYANNIKGFIRDHVKMRTLLIEVLNNLPRYEAAVKEIPAGFEGRFESPEKYNKWISNEMFLNPYQIPECIKKPMEDFIQTLNQFVYVEYLTPDSIVKLNNHKRNTVLLVDTDSNMLNADIFVSFVINELFPGETFGRSKLYNEMILVNVLAASIDRCVIKTLDFYGRSHHMDEASRAELTMKNEFMFRRFFLMKTKKRYAASIVLREGNIIIPFKPEIKGLDFIKAGVTDDVMKKFQSMLEDHILFSERLELHEMMKELKEFENEIYRDLHSGGTRFLKPQMYKAEGAYKKITDSNGRVIGSKAWSLPVFRGATIWNELYPTQKINSLDRVKLIKLTCTGLSDLEFMKTKYPEDYNKIVTKIFMSPNPSIKSCGLRVISIPSTLKKIPDWIIDLIDYDLITSDVISSFRSVLESLDIEETTYKTPNGNANITSCLISL